MDDQTAEKMAKLAADNLRMRDEVKVLKQRITKLVAVAPPLDQRAARVEVKQTFGDADPDRVMREMVDGLERQAEKRQLGELGQERPTAEDYARAVRLMEAAEKMAAGCLDEIEALKAQRKSPGAGALVAMQVELDAVQTAHDDRLGELEAMQTRYDLLYSDWEAERERAEALGGHPMHEGKLLVASHPERVAELEAEVELLRASEGGVARHLEADLRALQLAYDELEIRERHQGRELVNLQAAYAKLLDGDPGWQRDLWVEVYVAAENRPSDAVAPVIVADGALAAAVRRFGPASHPTLVAPFTRPPEYKGADPERMLSEPVTDEQEAIRANSATERRRREADAIVGTYADQAPGPPDPFPGVHHDGQGGQGGS